MDTHEPGVEKVELCQMGWISFIGYMEKGASTPPLSPWPHASLTGASPVAPLIPDQRCYGEAPGGSGEDTVRGRGRWGAKVPWG